MTNPVRFSINNPGDSSPIDSPGCREKEESEDASASAAAPEKLPLFERLSSSPEVDYLRRLYEQKVVNNTGELTWQYEKRSVPVVRSRLLCLFYLRWLKRPVPY
ncbi:MAG: hypothetical protein ACE5GN_06105 [Waddliaceae bacterium]